MNWEEIRKKNPKAIDKMENWLNETKHHFVKKGQERLLYDFFDENEIYISISVDDSVKQAIWFLGFIGKEIDCNLEDVKTRSEAEIVIFTKAFEILEQKL